MSASRVAGRAIALTQQIALMLAPHGGQAGARANALRAVAATSADARQRRHAEAAMVAAQRAHPVAAARWSHG